MHTLYHGDCLDILPTLAPVASIVTDPPAGIGFMGAEWDGDKGGRDAWVAWLAARLRAAAAHLPAGGAALVWALPRTSHWTALAIEEAGLRIDDRLSHIFGSGFPKHKSKLKPAVEDWWLARKPGRALPLDIDGCRVEGVPPSVPQPIFNSPSGLTYGMRTGVGRNGEMSHAAGRYPPHLLLTHSAACAPGACAEDCPAYVIGQQSGATRPAGLYKKGAHNYSGPACINIDGLTAAQYNDTGTAARYFPQFWPDGDAAPFLYSAKASRRERNAGCEGLEKHELHRYNNGEGFQGRTNVDGEWQNTDAPRIPAANHHPTVKNQTLMRWLVRLVTPPGGVCLDPFMGSGSTGVAAIAEGRGFVGIERDAAYYAIAQARIEDAANPLRHMTEEAA